MTAHIPGLPDGPGPVPSARETEGPDEQLRERFERSVDEGARRLGRSWPSLFATGVVGGLDVGAGVLALLVVEYRTHDELLGALAFTIGFIALTLAHSELFTEDFMMPVVAVVARQARVREVLRLWGGTAAMNLLGGWIATGLTIAALPHLRATAIAAGAHYTSMGIGWRSFASGSLGGGAITLMTWMERGTESMVGKLTAAVSIAFILAAGPLNHAIVASLLMFAAIHAHASFGYNVVGGVGLVTVSRLIQIGRAPVADERRRAPGQPRAPRTDV